ncbi:hypothetical protein AALB39_28805, partial [Lachnospiraceae bacterium 54-53]
NKYGPGFGLIPAPGRRPKGRTLSPAVQSDTRCRRSRSAGCPGMAKSSSLSAPKPAGPPAFARLMQFPQFFLDHRPARPRIGNPVQRPGNLGASPGGPNCSASIPCPGAEITKAGRKAGRVKHGAKRPVIDVAALALW